MPFLETALGQIALNTGATAIWETGRAFLNRTSQRSVEDLFLRSFEQACNDLRNSSEHPARYNELRFDDLAFRKLIRNEAVRPRPTAAASVQEAAYKEIIELLKDSAIIRIGDESLSDDGYKQLIRNVVRHAQARFKEALLKDEQGFRHLVSDTLAENGEQLTEMADLLESLDLPDIASSIRSIEVRTAQLSSHVGYLMSMTEDIHRKVVLQPSSPTQPLQLLFNVPKQNTFFTGRAELLQNLATALDAEQRTAIVQAVQGLGGVGKTQLAIKYVYENADKYSVIGWIRAEEVSTMQADLGELSVALGQAAENDSPSTKRSALNTWLGSNQGWLLIFDNAVGPDEIAPYIPSSRSGKVLITSRARYWKTLATTLQVSTWKRHESIEFIQKRLTDAVIDEVDVIADLLGDLPLALEQAVAYMEETECGPDGYARLFQEERKELWGIEECPIGYHHTVATTWNLSIKRIRQESEGAADLMNLLAYLAPEDIPLELLEVGATDLPNQLQSAFASTIKLQRVIRALTRYSLVESSGGFLNVHRLVQAVVRDHLTTEEQKPWLSAALKLTGVNGSFLFDDKSPETWPQCAVILPHALTVAHHAAQISLDLKSVTELLHRIAHWYSHNSQEVESVIMLREALRLRETYVDPLNPDLAPLLTDLGLAMMAVPPQFLLGPLTYPQESQADQDNQSVIIEVLLEENRQLFERAINIDRHHFTQTEPMRIAARLEPFGRFLRSLGCATRDRELLRQARNVQNEAYEIAAKEFKLGKEPGESLARFLNGQANTMRTLGEPDQAIEKFEYALSFFEPDPTTGDEHPDVAGITKNLAYALLQLGEFDKAEQAFWKSLTIFQKYYPEGHPKLFRTIFPLAQIYRYQDKVEDAQKLLDMLPNDLLDAFEYEFNWEVLPCFSLHPYKITVHEFLIPLKAKHAVLPRHKNGNLSADEVRYNGTTYKFPFPIESIPSKGSELCPCGSGKRFFACHKRDFQRALKANLTQRG